MRVLSVNDRTYYINLGLLDEMRKKNYQVSIVPLGNYKKEQQIAYLKHHIDRFCPDYVITPGWSVGIFETEAFLKFIKKSPIPHIYWATEDPLFFTDISMVFAPYSDYVFTLAEECIIKYNQLSLPSSTLMFGCNERIFKPVAPKKEYSHDIVLVANYYHWFSEDKSFRKTAIKNLVEPLVQNNYDLKIWGNDWRCPKNGYGLPEKFYAGPCSYEETPSIYSSAKIVLGLQSVNNSLTQTSTRTFEIMGTGAFYLTQHTPSHENLFMKHCHLTWSDSPEETLAIVDYYLKNYAEREKIGRQGLEEVHRKHCYSHRLNQLEKSLAPYLSKRKSAKKLYWNRRPF